MNLASCLTLVPLLGITFVSPLAQQAIAPIPNPAFSASSDSSTIVIDEPAAGLTGALAQQSFYPNPRAILHSYVNDLIGPSAFISAGLQAGVDQARPLKVGYPTDGYSQIGEHPAHGAIPEWGLGAEGYAKRYASRFGQGLIGTTAFYGVGYALQQDVTYHRCECTGILARSAHAFTASFVTHTRSGRAVPSLPALVSPLIASEVAVKAWYPQRYNTSDALRTSVTSYAIFPLRALVKEFTR